MRKVTLVPLYDVDEETIKLLKNFINVLTDMEVRVMSRKELPRSSLNPQRKQYNANAILDYLTTLHSGGDFIIGIADVDLFTPRLNFVFGLSYLLSGVAVISTRRLGNNFYNRPDDPQLFRRRVLTVAMYEVGHLLGLLSCREEECVMRTSRSIEEIDSKGYEYCDSCERSLKGLTFVFS